jgi:surface protein
MSISNEITRLTNAKAAIKQSIVNKGIRVSDSALLDEYPALIDKIEGGGEGGGPNPYQELYMQRTANETNMVGLFSYTPASTTLDLSAMNTSKVTDMSYMFNECKVPYLDLSGFDVSNVSNMQHMFHSCPSNVNIDGWDTSKLTNADYMFSNFTNGGKYLDLSVLDFSNVIKADSIFHGCNIDYVDIRNLNLNLAKLSSLPFKSVKGTVLDLSNYDITGLKKTYYLCYFCDCSTIDLTNWKTTEVTDMGSTFYYNSNLERLIIPDWDMTNTTNTSNFMYNVSKLKYIDLSRSNDTTINKITPFLPTKTLAAYGTVLVPADTPQTACDALIAKYWKPKGAAVLPVISSIDIAIELDEVFPGKSTKMHSGNPEPWYGDETITYVSSNESIATIDGDTITSTGVIGSTDITAYNKNQEVVGTATLRVSETDSYPNVIRFRSTSTPTSSTYRVKVNGTNIRLNTMDYNEAGEIFIYDAGLPITSISFEDASCTEILKINTSNMTDMSKMFYACNKLTELDLSSFNTTNVTNMGSMFYSCDGLTSLDLSSFDTTNVTDMHWMFYECYALNSLNLSNFDASNVTNIGWMFHNCNKLHTLRLDNCSNATISKIIKSSGFPTGTIEGVTRKIYCKKAEAAGLTEPKNWVFEFIDQQGE